MLPEGILTPKDHQASPKTQGDVRADMGRPKSHGLGMGTKFYHIIGGSHGPA